MRILTAVGNSGEDICCSPDHISDHPPHYIHYHPLLQMSSEREVLEGTDH